MEHILQVMKNTLTGLSLPKNIGLIDVVQVLLIAVVVYYFILWIKQTRAYTLFKGMILIALIVMIAALTGMETILWIFRNISTVVLVALVVIFQPELRKMLEQLGEKNTLSMLGMLNREKEGIERLGEQSVEEIIRACYEMGAVKTGALIVIEEEIRLDEYVRTGINIDGILTSQLLINIFEHNTPLHDGAVIVRGNRVVAATCYLPLSDNMELSNSWEQDTELVWESVRLQIPLQSLFQRKPDRFPLHREENSPGGLTANSFVKFWLQLRIRKWLTTANCEIC